ncbi:MAG: hypothetical protein K9J77_09320, partial [Rhodoferax sp.]|nr:hypothetical protein [Rhodoferax sp.]
MKINDQRVDSRVIAQWKRAIETCEDAALQAFASQHPHVSAGFRKGKVQRAVAVARISATLDHAGDLPTYLLEFLRSITLANPLLKVLSVEAIDQIHHDLAHVAGPVNLYGAMLLDERPEVRQIGWDGIAQWNNTPPSDQDREAAIIKVRQTLRTFAQHLIEPIWQVSANTARLQTPAAATQGVQARPPRDRNAIERMLELREKRQSLHRVRRELQELQSERDQLRRQTRDLEASLAGETAALARLQGEHHELIVRFAEKTQAAVRQQLQARLLPWLQPAVALAAFHAAPGPDLAQEVHDLLQRQAAADQKYGLRSVWEARLVQYQNLLERLQVAARESLCPLAELSAYRERLEQRIREILKILQQSSTTPQRARTLPVGLLERLQRADTLEKLAQVRSSLVAVEASGFLEPQDLEAAHTLLNDHVSRVYFRTTLGARSDGATTNWSGLPLHYLQRQLAHGQHCSLVVDGYNVIFKLPDLFGGHFETADPGAASRALLVQHLTKLAKSYPHLSVELWFDSSTAQDQTLLDNFRLHYSGG